MESIMQSEPEKVTVATGSETEEVVIVKGSETKRIIQGVIIATGVVAVTSVIVGVAIANPAAAAVTIHALGGLGALAGAAGNSR